MLHEFVQTGSQSQCTAARPRGLSMNRRFGVPTLAGPDRLKAGHQTSFAAQSCSRSQCTAQKSRGLYMNVFSVSRFHVPQQGRSKIAQRFIAGLWSEYETSPVRDERTHRSSPIFSVAPLGLWPFSTRNLSVVPIGTLGSVLFRR